MIHGQVAYDEMEDIDNMKYVEDCRVRDTMRELRIEFYNKLSKYVKEPLLMDIGNSLLNYWKENPENVANICSKLNLDEEHWQALDDDYQGIKKYLEQKDYDRNMDDNFYDFNW